MNLCYVTVRQHDDLAVELHIFRVTRASCCPCWLFTLPLKPSCSPLPTAHFQTTTEAFRLLCAVKRTRLSRQHTAC